MSDRPEAGRPSRVRVRTPGKHIVAFAGAALLMTAGTIGIVKFAPRPSSAAAAPAPNPAGSPSEATRSRALSEFLVDLAPDETGRAAYLRLAASVSAGAEAATAVRSHEEEIRERIAFLLRGLSADDLEGAEGMSLLKEEMLRRVNLVIAPAAAEDVTITDIVVQ
jgi:flagellar FliL protein